MVTPVWRIQRELEYAQARETYYRNRQPSATATVISRKATKVGYRPLLLKVGSTVPVIAVRASDKAVTYFGRDALNLVDLNASGAPDSIPDPKGFSPSLVKAMKGATTPGARRAFNSTGRRYVKYSDNTEGETQAHYQAPISGGMTPTVTTLQTAFDTIVAAKSADLKLQDYGRIELQLERFNQSRS